MSFLKGINNLQWSIIRIQVIYDFNQQYDNHPKQQRLTTTAADGKNKSLMAKANRSTLTSIKHTSPSWRRTAFDCTIHLNHTEPQQWTARAREMESNSYFNYFYWLPFCWFRRQRIRAMNLSGAHCDALHVNSLTHADSGDVSVHGWKSRATQDRVIINWRTLSDGVFVINNFNDRLIDLIYLRISLCNSSVASNFTRPIIILLGGAALLVTQCYIRLSPWSM